jgi:hypothetical protein
VNRIVIQKVGVVAVVGFSVVVVDACVGDSQLGQNGWCGSRQKERHIWQNGKWQKDKLIEGNIYFTTRKKNGPKVGRWVSKRAPSYCVFDAADFSSRFAFGES